ncbi:hypothetical protein QLZ24_09945 [Cronobacter dublinensis]|nr:hypothetical protein [Cronobacter dublinensis]
MKRCLYDFAEILLFQTNKGLSSDHSFFPTPGGFYASAYPQWRWYLPSRRGMVGQLRGHDKSDGVQTVITQSHVRFERKAERVSIMGSVLTRVSVSV